MDFKRFQKYIIASYRIMMTSVLVLLVVGAFSYLFLMLFYTIDRNWAAPLVLSPTQEKVLAYQPQVSAMEGARLKDKVDLTTAEQKYRAVTTQIIMIKTLIAQFDAASSHESNELATTAVMIQDILKEKKKNDSATARVVADMQPMLVSVDEELADGLITKSEASTRRMNMQTSIDSLTDARASEVELAEQRRAAGDASQTLGSAHALSLLALQSVANEGQLKIALVQAQVDAQTARLSVEQLQATMRDADRVLAIAKQSPYYLALTQRVPVAFMPYDNLSSAAPGAAVYDCYLEIVLCHQVGAVLQVYEAEEYTHTPLFKADVKGKIVGVRFSDPKASESALLFIGHKPLLL